MYSIKYEIITKAPVLISANSGDRNMTATEEYISGSSVIGFLADRFIKVNKLNSDAHKDSVFSNLFLNGKVNYFNAYITDFINQDNETVNYFLPYSIQKFKYDENENKDKAIDDLLLEEDDEDKVAPKSSISKYGFIKDKKIFTTTVDKTLNFHHKRDSKKGISEDMHIFNYEAILPFQKFTGFITSENKDLLIKIKELSEGLNSVYIGKSRSAEYGRVNFKIISSIPEEFISEIKFNNLNIEDLSEICLTAISPLIIYNKFGYSVADAFTLQEKLSDFFGVETKIVKSLIRSSETENFLNIWKVKKPSENTIDAGSSFIISFKENLSKQELTDKLILLLKKGIGERKNEGFGRIAVNLQRNDEKYKITSKEKPVVKKPETLNSISKNIFHTILNNLFKSAFEELALNDLPRSISKSSKSIISRIESMIKQSKDEEDFKKQIESLRETAKDNLKNIGLYSKIKKIKYDDIIERANSKLIDLQGLIKEVNFVIEIKTKFHLYKLYWLTLFSVLRKQIKGGK